MSMKCAEVMRRPLGKITPNSDLQTVAQTMREESTGFFPVVNDEGEAVGVVTDRDIVVRACTDGLPLEQTSVGSVMSRELVACRPEDELSVAIALMKAHQKSRVLITDAGNHLQGVLSLTDIAQYAEPLTVAELYRSVCAREFRVLHP